MCPSSTVVKHSTINLKVKASVPANETWREKMGERYLDGPNRTVAEHSTHNLKVKGSKPATDIGREKMVKIGCCSYALLSLYALALHFEME